MLNSNIIVNDGDLELCVILTGRCPGQTRGRGARQGRAGQGRAGEGKATLVGKNRVADSRGRRGRDQDRASIWKEIEEEIADVSCLRSR